MTTPTNVITHFQETAKSENVAMQNAFSETENHTRKEYVAKINECYTHFKLFLNAAIVAGFDEISLDVNNQFHIERVRESVVLLRKFGFSSVIVSTIEETLFNRLSFFAHNDNDQRSYLRGYFYNVNGKLSSQQKSEYKENINRQVNVEQKHEPASNIESPLSNENQALICIFKVMFTFCDGMELGLIGRSLRNYFKTRYPLNSINDSDKGQFDEFMNLPLFVPIYDLTDIQGQIKNWIKLIRNEQLNLANIKSDESTGKLLEIGVDENVEQAIKNVLNKLPLLETNMQKGLSLNQLKNWIKNKELWTYFESGVKNYFNHLVLF